MSLPQMSDETRRLCVAACLADMRGEHEQSARHLIEAAKHAGPGLKFKLAIRASKLLPKMTLDNADLWCECMEIAASCEVDSTQEHIRGVARRSLAICHKLRSIRSLTKSEKGTICAECDELKTMCEEAVDE